MFAFDRNARKSSQTESCSCNNLEYQICQESLDALNLRSIREALSIDAKSSNDHSNSWGSVTSGSEASAPALTDCSSRSSLTDLDISIDQDDYGYGFHDFKDLPATPTGQQQYLTPLSSPAVDSPSRKKQTPQHAYLPRILQHQSSQSRSVSFSGIEEVFGESSCRDGEQDESTERNAFGIIHPRTPVHQYYYSSKKPSHHQALPPRRLAYPPLATKPRRTPQLQPRRSALKKQIDEGCLEYPVSPKILWYGAPTKTKG